MYLDEYTGYLPDSPDDLEQYGTKRHSGRYPYGSGDDPFQHEVSFINHVYDLRDQGLKETEIAKSMEMTTTDLRARVASATKAIKAYQTQEAVKLKAKGYSNVAIGKRMGINESSVRLLLDPSMQKKRTQMQTNVDFFREQVEKHGMLDVGAGVEEYIGANGISKDAARKAIAALEREGYSVLSVKVPQLGTQKETTLKVLAKPGTTWAYAKKNRDQIALPDPCFGVESGNVIKKLAPPVRIDPKRIMVRYAEEGGLDKDGCIEIRPGVKDLDLGSASYAQVRIAVQGERYIKGVAVRCHDPKEMPEGVDIIVNSNKKKGTPLIDPDPDAKQVLKPMQNDPDNPFGATIRYPEELKRCQATYDDNGEKKQSALNIVSEEGTWSGWTKSLPSQFLGKQSPVLAKKQLNLQKDMMLDEYKSILELDNPAIKRELLLEFAGKCANSATHMSAAAFPRQSTRLLLPFKNVKDGEIFCPGLNTGEHVIAIRYPHAGIFEIPYLMVNNNIKEAKETIGNAIDACGISPKTAQQLSGADYDGDTAVIIPVDKLNGIRVESMIKELKEFDPGDLFPEVPGMHRMTKLERGREMGSVSNLITDMTIMGASQSEILRAVKHSMVVIDAYKHHYNYKLSEEVYGIKELKKLYQGGERRGASTLLSRSTGEVHIPVREEKHFSEMTDEEKERWRNGEMIYKNTNSSYTQRVVDKEGNVSYIRVPRTETISKMENAFDQGKDAWSLTSGGSPETSRRIERVYAEYANAMMDIRKQALAAARALPDIQYDPAARVKYKTEYQELLDALSVAHRNAPLERAAQVAANKEYSNKVYNSPVELDAEKKKKLKSDILKRARFRFGAGKTTINITEKQWEAINAGAVTKTVLNDIIDNADKDRLKSLAMPKASKGIGSAKLARAKSLLGNGYSQEDVASMLDVSVTTLMRAIEEA